MSNDNWLIKLCSEQPTNEAELEQALTEMSPEQLMSLDSAPTPGLDSMDAKIAFADQMGREMAIQNPGILRDEENAALVGELSDEEAVKLAHDLGIDLGLEKQAFLGAAKGLMGKALTSGAGKKMFRAAAKNPNAATAAIGAGVGAMHSKATGGSALGGAMGGAALGYGAGRLGAGRALRKGMVGAQRWGRRANKSALGGGGPVASAMGPNTPVSFASHRVGNFSKNASIKQAMEAMAAEKDASIISTMGRGGKLTTMRSAQAKPTIQSMVAKRGGKAPRPLPGMPRAKGTPPPIPGVLKTAFLRSDHKNEWLEQFEGTPLLQAALDMAKQELASETQAIEEREARKQEHMGSDERWVEQDKLRLQKKDLELQLIAQRNGLGSESSEPGPEEGEGMPPGEAPELGSEEGVDPAQATIESPAGQEAVGAIKEAGRRLAARNFI